MHGKKEGGRAHAQPSGFTHLTDTRPDAGSTLKIVVCAYPIAYVSYTYVELALPAGAAYASALNREKGGRDALLARTFCSSR